MRKKHIYEAISFVAFPRRVRARLVQEDVAPKFPHIGWNNFCYGSL